MTSVSPAHQKSRTKLQKDIMSFLVTKYAHEMEGHDVIATLYQVIEDLSRNIIGFVEDPMIRINVIDEIKNYNRQLERHLEEYKPLRPSSDISAESRAESGVDSPT